MVPLNTSDSLAIFRCSPFVSARLSVPFRFRFMPWPRPLQQLDQDELEKADDMEAILFP